MVLRISDYNIFITGRTWMIQPLHSRTNVHSTNIPTMPDSEDANIKKTKFCVLQDKLTGKRGM